MVGEDVEDHRGAVDDGQIERGLEVALLPRGQFVVARRSGWRPARFDLLPSAPPACRGRNSGRGRAVVRIWTISPAVATPAVRSNSLSSASASSPSRGACGSAPIANARCIARGLRTPAPMGAGASTEPALSLEEATSPILRRGPDGGADTLSADEGLRHGWYRVHRRARRPHAASSAATRSRRSSRSAEKATRAGGGRRELVTTATLADRAASAAAMEGADAVIHGAAIYEVGIPKRERPAMYEANVAGTENALGAALDAGISARRLRLHDRRVRQHPRRGRRRDLRAPRQGASPPTTRRRSTRRTRSRSS